MIYISQRKSLLRVYCERIYYFCCRYTIYEDFDKVVAKDKKDLYGQIDEGDVDWFSDYDESESAAKAEEEEALANRYNDYRFTECYSSIKPPDLLSAQPPPASERKENETNVPETQAQQKPRDEEYEMRRPKLLLKQNYYDHVQKIINYINGNYYFC